MTMLCCLALPSWSQNVSGLSFTTSTLNAGYSTNATVTLNTVAPAGGFIVLISSTSSAVAYPTRVDVPAGQTTVSFRVATNAVNDPTVAPLTAAGQLFNSGSATANLTVNPSAVISVPVSEDAYVGWTDAANHGTTTQLVAKDGLDGIHQAIYLKFDLTNITDVPVGATLRMSQAYFANNGFLNIGCYSVTDTTWGETTINGANNKLPGTHVPEERFATLGGPNEGVVHKPIHLSRIRIADRGQRDGLCGFVANLVGQTQFGRRNYRLAP